MIADLIRLGDKIDINFLHHNNGKTYKSSVFDIFSETELEIGMPTENGRMVLFQVGMECQFYFYTQKGIFTCEGVVKERYKKDNFYLLSIKTTSELKKFQRRDFFRVECTEDFYYYAIPKEVAELETTEEIFEIISDLDYMDKVRFGHMQDLSGGGGRFMANEDLEIGSFVVSVIRLTNNKVDKTFYLVTEVISCDPVEKIPGKKMIRCKYWYKDAKDRELIIRYVFEQDRCRRQKENG